MAFERQYCLSAAKKIFSFSAKKAEDAYRAEEHETISTSRLIYWIMHSPYAKRCYSYSRLGNVILLLREDECYIFLLLSVITFYSQNGFGEDL